MLLFSEAFKNLEWISEPYKCHYFIWFNCSFTGFPAGSDVTLGSIPGSVRAPGEGGNPLQYSYLRNSMDRAAWQAAIHGVAKSD